MSTVPLRPGDLPSSWTAKAHDTSQDASDAASNKKLDMCVGVKDVSGDLVKTVNSKDYSMGQSSITSRAKEYKSSSDVDASVKLFASPKVQPCFVKQFQQELATGLPRGTKVGKPVLKITPGTGGGPSNVVGTGTAKVPVMVSGQSVTVYTSGVYIRGDKIEAEVSFTGVGSPVDADTMTKAVAAVAKRARG